MKKIVLPAAVRVFRKITPDGSRLGQTEYRLEEGDEIEVEIESVVYDHNDQIALRFVVEGEPYYVLLSETGLSQDMLH